jgi:hypothetical protein
MVRFITTLLGGIAIGYIIGMLVTLLAIYQAVENVSLGGI